MIWISANENKPDHHQDVLLFDLGTHLFHIGWWDALLDRFIVENDGPNSDISHWAEIEKPEGA
jgi:hypothetical protein